MSSATARRRSCWARAGATIKTIGELARKEMEEIFGRRVHLFLFVKVREDWAEKREHYQEMGSRELSRRSEVERDGMV